MAKGKTKDERFLIELYEFAKNAGDMATIINPFKLGSSLGHKEHKVKGIIRFLAQANFVRKMGQMEISMTPHGCNLAEELLAE